MANLQTTIVSGALTVTGSASLRATSVSGAFAVTGSSVLQATTVSGALTVNGAKLHVSQSDNVGSTSLLMENTSASPTNRLTNIDLKENGSLVGSFGHQSVGGPFGDGAAGGYFAARAATEGFSILAGGVASANVAMRILSDGNVGIGTTSPNEKLSISGNAGSYTALKISNGAAGGRSYGFASTDNTNGNGGGKFGIYDFTSSAYRMMIDSTGNVGIGTTAPNRLLTVAGAAGLGLGSELLTNNTFTSNITPWSSASFGGGTTSGGSWNAGGWADFAWTVGGTNEQIRANEVAIGNASVGDIYMLSFRAKASSNGMQFASISLAQGASPYGANIAASNLALTTAFQQFNYPIVISNAGNPSIQLIFFVQTNTTGTWSLDDVYLKKVGNLYASADGNVGIGTTAPQNKLDIASTDFGLHIGATLPLNGWNGLSIGYSDGTTNNYRKGGLAFIRTDTDYGRGDVYILNDNAGDLNSVTITDVHTTFQRGGNVGIGTTSPGAQLQVNSSAAGTIGEIIKGAASQSADLLQAQNSSSSVLAQITSNGTIKSSVGVYVGNDQLSSVLQNQMFS